MAKPLLHGEIAICMLNLETKNKDFTINWDKIKIKGFSGIYKDKNLWENRFIGNTEGSYSVKISARDVLIFRLIKSIE